MFARGFLPLHAACPERSRRAHLPAPKCLRAKSRVSATSKLTEIKGLQLYYFGHLRKTGGWGSNGHLTRDVHREPVEGLLSGSSVFSVESRPISAEGVSHSPKFNHSHTYESFSRKLNHSRTYKTPGGGGSRHTNMPWPYFDS